MGFPDASVGKESAWNAGDVSSIPRSGRSLGGGHGNPLQYSWLENPMNQWDTIHRITKSQTRLKWLSTHILMWGFPGGAIGKEPICQFRRLKRHRFDPSIGKIPWSRKWQHTPVFLPGESHGQRTLEATVYMVAGHKQSQVAKSWRRQLSMHAFWCQCFTARKMKSWVWLPGSLAY